jgi:hypothetical protein
MFANFAFHSGVSSTILVIVIAALLIGIIGGVARFMLKKLGKCRGHLNKLFAT